MLELTVIFLLLACNGLYAMTETALVSARRARLRQMADDGHAGAAHALKLLENPERFLSSVQIGITLVGVVSGAYGGATLAARLTPWLAGVPALQPYAGALAFWMAAMLAAVVVSLTLRVPVEAQVALAGAEEAPAPSPPV